ncbi:MAG: amidase family protein [Gammaproteobacteria bacterium]|nr:amidase family protein [Gammaproteobacteria bacterium]
MCSVSLIRPLALLLGLAAASAAAQSANQPAMPTAVGPAPTAAAARFPVEELSIASLQAAYRAGTTTAVEVVQASLDRIEAYDKRGPLLNSLITVNPAALQEAAALDAQRKAGAPLGALHGVPVVVKDNIDVAGLPMTSGFQGWKHYRPPADAPLVAKLRAAGAVIIAKASLSEFARGGGDNINSVLSGFARNPYHTAYATGGSSGGTGASVAASFAVVGIGTDTGGSVRMPSAHNALAGLRPTVGLVSRTGIVPLDSVRDTAGPMARSVADMAILLDVIAGPDPQDAATSRSAGHQPASYRAALKPDALKGARLGVLRQVFSLKVADPRVIARFEQTLAELKAAGAILVDPFTVPELDQIPRPPQTPAQFKADLTQWIAQHPGVPYPSMQAIADSKLVHPLHQAGMDLAAAAGPVETDADTLAGARGEQAYRDGFTRAMKAAKVDAVVFPTWAQLPALNGDRNTQLVDAPQPPPNAGPTALGSSLTFVGSALQWPALSVPSGYLGDGLPIGLQILGRAWDEARIIGYAHAYEQATRYRHPPASVPPLASSFASRFVGTWKLVEILERDASGATRASPRGPSTGQLVYGADGRLSVQIMKLGRPSVASGALASASASELQGVVDGFSSYFGSWELLPAEGCVVHVQDGQLLPNNIGSRAKRYYGFDGEGRLSLATPPRGEPGRETAQVFVWERIS